MLLWMSFAVLTAAVLAYVLKPLWAALPEVRTAGDPAAVYRDQLKEIDGELERGVIGKAEAAAARIEISRRLIASAETPPAQQPEGAGSPRLSRLTASAIAILAPLAAVGIYLAVGEPHLPDQPLLARTRTPPQAPQGADIGKLVAAVEARLATHPEEGQGWDVIAPVYFRMGRFDKAAEAYRNAIRLLGETPRRLAGLAESGVTGANGRVIDESRRAYERLAQLEPKRIEPRFWLALAKEQAGKLAEAAGDYRALIAEADPSTPWKGMVEERLAIAEGRKAPDEMTSPGAIAPVPPAESKGPAAADVAAAQSLDPVARQKLIESMVGGLAERLKKDGGDLAAWQKLIRAYAVMGRREDALAALKDARRNLGNEPQSLTALTDLARSLGLET